MFYQILQLVEREAKRQLNTCYLGPEYRSALTDLITVLNRLMRFN